jgi:hypothetical protein
MPVYAIPWKAVVGELSGAGGVAVVDENLCYRYYAGRAGGPRYPELVEPRSAEEMQEIIDRRRRGRSGVDVYVVVTGRESTEPQVPPAVLAHLLANARLAGTRKYLPIDPAYRRVKARLLGRDSYDAKLTLYHFVA